MQFFLPAKTCIYYFFYKGELILELTNSSLCKVSLDKLVRVTAITDTCNTV